MSPLCGGGVAGSVSSSAGMMCLGIGWFGGGFWQYDVIKVANIVKMMAFAYIEWLAEFSGLTLFRDANLIFFSQRKKRTIHCAGVGLMGGEGALVAGLKCCCFIGFICVGYGLGCRGFRGCGRGDDSGSMLSNTPAPHPALFPCPFLWSPVSRTRLASGLAASLPGSTPFRRIC